MKSGCLAAALVLASICYAADTENRFTVVDQIVAKVNGDIITEDELQRLSRELAQQLKSQGDNGEKFEQDFQTDKKNILEHRIDELLLVQKAKDLDIDVTSDVNKYMADLQRRAMKDNPKLADPDKFHDWVRQQAGMSFEDFQNETKNNFYQRAVIQQEVGRHINVTHQEVLDYYNKHKSDFIRDERVYLSEILISTENKNEAGIAAAKKKADQIAEEAAKGENFAQLARDNSDANTANQGGELGVGYKKGELAKEFEDVVWNLPKGGVTKPIRIPAGWEILKVDDHTKAGLAPLADVEPQIENALYGPKMEPKIREYLTDLRRNAFLQIRPGYVDTGAAKGQNTAWQEQAELKPETVTKAEVTEKRRHKRLLGIPIPGTHTESTGKSSSR